MCPCHAWESHTCSLVHVEDQQKEMRQSLISWLSFRSDSTQVEIPLFCSVVGSGCYAGQKITTGFGRMEFVILNDKMTETLIGIMEQLDSCILNLKKKDDYNKKKMFAEKSPMKWAVSEVPFAVKRCSETAGNWQKKQQSQLSQRTSFWKLTPVWRRSFKHNLTYCLGRSQF